MKKWLIGIVVLIIGGIVFISTIGAQWTTENMAKKADAGDVEAMIDVAGRYYRGAGSPVDYEKAMHYDKMAAEAGNARSMYMVGTYYKRGLGAAKDQKMANEWFRKAALKGYGQAITELGGENSTEYKQALAEHGSSDDRMIVSAEGGNVNAQYMLGNKYYRQKIYSDAYKWLSKAAEQGHPHAKYELGLMHYAGNRPASDDKQKAFQYFMQAANNDVGEAQYNVGHMYLRGYGVQQDNYKAYKWMQIAVTRHPEVASVETSGEYSSTGETIGDVINLAKRKLSKQEVERVEAEVREWQPEASEFVILTDG